MIEDRVMKAKGAMANCLSMCSEVTLGLFFIPSALILYDSVFLATLLSNCRGWRNLSKDDYKKLETSQLRYLKRIMKAPLSSSKVMILLDKCMRLKNYFHLRKIGLMKLFLFLMAMICLSLTF